MRKLFACLTAACLMASLLALAEEEKKPQRPAGAGGPPGAAGGRLAMGLLGMPPAIVEKLDLTGEQKKKVAEIGEKYGPQLQEIQQKAREEFNSVLTENQKQTLREALEQMRQRFQQGRPGGANQ